MSVRWLRFGLSVVVRAASLTTLAAAALPASVYGQDTTAQSADEQASVNAQKAAIETIEPTRGEITRLEADFANFLHFASIGSFDIADAHAKSLLALPDINPLSDEAADALRRLSEKYRNSIDILLIVINNSPIDENAQKILSLIREAHRRERMNTQRIANNIRLLAGTPTQRATGLTRLVESGEYAIPVLIETLADPREKDLHPFIVRALPKLGKKALNPLVVAILIDDAVVQRYVAEALGRIGYPQALAYLKRLVTSPQANAAVREAAGRALTQIVTADPAAREEPAAILFRQLAEQYYADTESLRPDPREDRANVWFLRQGKLVPVEVPRAIFPMVMCMQCCEASLELNGNQPGTLGLWLAANFRREARLGLDVESGEVVETDDRTRPAGYLRSIYFARSAGPRYCQLVLDRAIKDRDRDVALGAIAALNVTTGAATLADPTGPAATSLAGALHFPDLLVRIKAALALGRAMPPVSFQGDDEVVPILASALSLKGMQSYLVVEPEATLRGKLKADLERSNAHVVAAERLQLALAGAHKELTHLDAIFLASDIDRPGVVEAIKEIGRDRRFGLVPIVLYVKENDVLVANRVGQADPRVGRVLVVLHEGDTDGSLAELLLAKKQETASKLGHHEISPELGLSLALDAAQTLQAIVVAGSAVFDAGVAQQALIDALAYPNEDLRIASARVLAKLDNAPVQAALADVALETSQTESLRIAAFGALAESACRFGHRLNEAQTKSLIQQTLNEESPALRTAASQALGAMNLPGPLAVETILMQPKD